MAVPLLVGAATAMAETATVAETAADTDASLTEIVVTGDRLDVIPTKPIDSVFGFGKSVMETPRSVTTISSELLEKTIITNINDLVALTPGAFTESFFGVAGSLDVRGSPGENYFRGMRRVANPGNYPVAIGASDSIDVVRGPASPIYGPSQIGGYLNFVPKSARAGSGKYLTEDTGQLNLTTGSWGKRVLTGEVGGPASVGGKELGYYVYGQSEDSGSYYENSATRQSILQTSFNMEFSENLRTEFGGMYQYFKGNQVAGWNRLSQALVNNGTYVTGSPPSLDTNGDGLLSTTESNAGRINQFYAQPFVTPAALAALIAGKPNMALVNPGIGHIDGNQVLVGPQDSLGDDVLTLYFDLIGQVGGIKITNKTFYESLKNTNLNAYGFSQYAKTYVAEDQLVFAASSSFGDAFKADVQFSPSIRYSGFEHGDNFSNEYFDRRDLTQPNSPIDTRTQTILGQDLYSSRVRGHYADYGLAFLTDLSFFKKLDALLGARVDHLTMYGRDMPGLITPSNVEASGDKNPVSYSASISYDVPFGLRPYVTYAKESTLILGQGGELQDTQLVNGAQNAVGNSDLKEVGIKATELDGHLYMALDYFDQRRVDYNAQATVTNNTTKAKGYEFEARYVVTPELTITGAYTNLKIYDIVNSNFVDLGAGDLALLGINPALVYGGVVSTVVPVPSGLVRKAGIPENVFSANFLFSFDPWVHGLSGTVAVSHVDSVPSGFTEVVTLPSYTLVNLGLRYETGHWAFNATVKNATDERYFRSNFPDLFGENVVLPELPRNYIVAGTYKF